MKGKELWSLFLSNCKEDDYKPVLTQHLEKHMPYDNSRYITDYRLELIAMTFENELSRMGYSIYVDGNHNNAGRPSYLERVRNGVVDNRNVIRLIDDDYFEVVDTGTIHALTTSKGECPICFSKGHTAESCFKLSDWCRSHAYIRDNPKIQERMIKVRPTPRKQKGGANMSRPNNNHGPPKHVVHEVNDNNSDDSIEMENETNEKSIECEDDSNSERDVTSCSDDERALLRCINMPDDDETDIVDHCYIEMDGITTEDTISHPTVCHVIDKIQRAWAHIDDGSALNAVCDKKLLFGYVEYTKPRIIGQDAQGTKILAYGDGYARYVAKGPVEGYHDTKSYYAPALTTNFLSVNRLEIDVNGPRSSGDKNRMSFVRKDWSTKVDPLL